MTLLLTVTSNGQSLLRPTDLPPSPFNIPPSASTHSETEMQRMRLDLTLVTTNEAESLLVREIRDLTDKLGDLTKDAYAKDPLLRTYDQYLERPHAWAQTQHRADNAVISSYYAANGDSDEKKHRQEIQNRLSGLCQLVLIKELGSNTNFAPLLKSAFEEMETMAGTNTNFRTRGSLYWQYDRLIGYQSPNRPARVTQFDDYLAAINSRYDLLMEKIAAIQQEEAVPQEVLDYIKYGDTYRLLDGCAEFYVELHTPEILRKTREQLTQKYRDLSWARQPK